MTSLSDLISAHLFDIVTLLGFVIAIPMGVYSVHAWRISAESELGQNELLGQVQAAQKLKDVCRKEKNGYLALAAVTCIAMICFWVKLSRDIIDDQIERESDHWAFLLKRNNTVTEAASNLIRMEACRAAWNIRVFRQKALADKMSLMESPVAADEPVGSSFRIGNVRGTKYAYQSDALANVDICGWYFVPNNDAIEMLPNLTISIIQETQHEFQTAAEEITPLIPADGTADNDALNEMRARISFDKKFQTAISSYRKKLEVKRQELIANYKKNVSVLELIPITYPPELNIRDSERSGGFWAWLTGRSSDEAWRLRKLVSNDMMSYDFYKVQKR